MTAVAGVSSITVSWEPPSGNDVPVTGYRVVAEPGPATCRPAAGQTSCVLGAVAGRNYRAYVIAEADAGLENWSAASDPVTPAAPPVTPEPPATDLTLTTDRGDVETIDPGQRLTLIGTGFAAYSTVTITIYSDPRVLATVTTDAAGAFRYAVRIPADLDAGEHTLVAAGVDPDGEPYRRALTVTVEDDGAGGGDDDGWLLPVRGPDIGRAVVLWVLLLGVVLVGLGSGLARLGRRSR